MLLIHCLNCLSDRLAELNWAYVWVTDLSRPGFLDKVGNPTDYDR